MFKNFVTLCLILIFISSCSNDKSTTTATNSENVSVVGVGGNFSNPLGLIYYIKNDATFSTATAKDSAGSQLTTNQDSIVKSFNNKIYVFSRDSNSAVLVLDNSGENKDPIANYSLSELDPDGDIDIDGGFNGTNPYDIVFESESVAYVGFYNSNFILKINPLTGKRLAAIDVSIVKTLPGATASDATVPNIVDLELINGNLYILAQRLNASFEPLEPTIVIFNTSISEFIDTNTMTTEIDGIILSGKNPSEMIYHSDSGKIYVAHSGAVTYSSDFSEIESTETGSTGIEEVVVASNSTNGIIISGTAFGGTTGGFGVSKLLYDSSNGKMFAVYNAFDFSANIKQINISLASVDATSILAENATAFGDTTIGPDGYIYQINRSEASPSINIYNPETKVLVKSIATELPLQSITFVK